MNATFWGANLHTQKNTHVQTVHSIIVLYSITLV